MASLESWQASGSACSRRVSSCSCLRAEKSTGVNTNTVSCHSFLLPKVIESLRRGHLLCVDFIFTFWILSHAPSHSLPRVSRVCCSIPIPSLKISSFPDNGVSSLLSKTLLICPRPPYFSSKIGQHFLFRKKRKLLFSSFSSCMSVTGAFPCPSFAVIHFQSWAYESFCSKIRGDFRKHISLLHTIFPIGLQLWFQADLFQCSSKIMLFVCGAEVPYTRVLHHPRQVSMYKGYEFQQSPKAIWIAIEFSLYLHNWTHLIHSFFFPAETKNIIISSMDIKNGKRVKWEGTWANISMTDSCWCLVETNAILKSNYPRIKNE